MAMSHGVPIPSEKMRKPNCELLGSLFLLHLPLQFFPALRFPFAGAAPGLADLLRRHLLGKPVASLSCIFNTLGAGEIEKHVRRNIVLGYGLSFGEDAT